MIQREQETRYSATSEVNMPAGVVMYARTPVFNHQEIPKGLSKSHRTGKGVWSELVIDQGLVQLDWLDDSGKSLRLQAGEHSTIPPLLMHRVDLLSDDARFHLDFYRLPDESAGPSGSS